MSPPPNSYMDILVPVVYRMDNHHCFKSSSLKDNERHKMYKMIMTHCVVVTVCRDWVRVFKPYLNENMSQLVNKNN